MPWAGCVHRIYIHDELLKRDLLRGMRILKRSVRSLSAN